MALPGPHRKYSKFSFLSLAQARPRPGPIVGPMDLGPMGPWMEDGGALSPGPIGPGLCTMGPGALYMGVLWPYYPLV